LPDSWAAFMTATPSSDDGTISHGEVFTRPWVVGMILDLAGYGADKDLAALRAVEPACGSGAFLVPMARRLSESCRQHGRSIEEATDAIHAVDLNAEHVESARAAVVGTLVDEGWRTAQAWKLAETWVREADFILGPNLTGTADYVLGNPPYVRPEEVEASRLLAYRRACPTMGGRADLFIAFFEMGLRALKREGTLAFICADRWMHNQYGQNLRAFIGEHFAMEATIVMHNVDAFEEQVSAYPAVTVIRRHNQGPAIIADTTANFGQRDAEALVRWAKGARANAMRTRAFEVAQVDHCHTGKEGWPGGSPNRLALIADIEARFPCIGDADRRTRVRIGVATGADNLFVTTDPELVEPERLLPLSMVEDLRSDRFEWSGHYLIDPWATEDLPARLDPRSGLVDLDLYPRLRSYFDGNQAALGGRKRHMTDWYATIDRVEHSVTARPKLLFPDIKLTSRPVYEPGGFYPHHNLYYIVSEDWPLEVLGGLLLSKFADLFIRTYAVKMRGSTPRFQAQYLRRICVPTSASIGPEASP
jgi:hypothetical protein